MSEIFKMPKFNPNILPEARGLQNTSSLCYYNSLIQCLLSCTQLYESKISEDLFSIYKGENHLILWQKMINASEKRSDNVKMNSGQQDAHEGFMIIMDMQSKDVNDMFSLTYKTTIGCKECGKNISEKRGANICVQVPADCKDMQTYIKRHNTEMDDFKCKFCNKTTKTVINNELVKISPLICIVLKKYDSKTVIEVPDLLKFLDKEKKHNFVYKLVAQSEHSGGRGGGHYWAICQRRDSVKRLDDSSVSQGKFAGTENTYLVFYSYLELETI